jgi:hypothetical protein
VGTALGSAIGNDETDGDDVDARRAPGRDSALGLFGGSTLAL